MGKTHWKAFVVDAAGEQTAVSVEPAHAKREWKYPAIDTEKAWAWVLEAGAAFARDRFESVLPITHGAAAALVRDERLAMPVMDYEAEPPAHVSEAYDRLRPAFMETGSPSLARGLNLGRQLAWQASIDPHGVAGAVTATLPQYWSWRLGGSLGVDTPSLGCHTDLWCPLARAPSPAVRALSLSLAPIVRSGEPTGMLAPAVARAWGLERPVAVLAGAHDSNVALWGARDADALVSTGTWSIAFARAADPACLDPSRDMLLNVAIDGTPVPSARAMTGREWSVIAQGGAAPTVAAALSAIERGAIAFPSFSGTGPYGERSGSVEGELHNADERAALASLTCAWIIEDLLLRLVVKGAVLLDGPAADDPVIVAGLTALRGADVRIPSRSLLASGAARLASGRPPCAVCKPTRTYEPAVIDRLRAHAARWRAMLDRQA